MEAVQVDGNNLLEVYQTTQQLAASIRENPRPVMLECITFRMRGHEEASGTKYYPEGLQEQWAAKDPVTQFEAFVKAEGVVSEDQAQRIKESVRQEIASALEEAFAEGPVVFDAERELGDLFAPHQPANAEVPSGGREIRMIEAIQEGLKQSMERHPQLVLMGQDIAEYGGVFKMTEGFVQQFGKERVRNTPLCESAILGAGLGLSIQGHKAMVEMQFADFVSEGMTQICNNLAKIHYRWGQNADVVVRMPTGAGVNAGPFHSQSNEAWFAHTAGLKVAYPAFPADAKGLLNEAFNDPNPVLFFEHKALYRSLTGLVPEEYYALPFGVARTVRPGQAVSVIAYGMAVHWALEAVAALGVDAEIIDLRTLVPLDRASIIASVRKTGRAVVFHEDVMTGGFGADIAAMIADECFAWLDAPVKRVASLDLPVPFAAALEEGYLPQERFKSALMEVLKF
jgi:2-oxoisovalerate dehydrogenase E1 component